MHFVKKNSEEKRKNLNDKLKSNKILRVPGAYNPLTAKVIEEIGYEAVYVSGGVMANDLGYPDIGLTTLKDVSNKETLLVSVTLQNLIKELFQDIRQGLLCSPNSFHISFVAFHFLNRLSNMLQKLL